MNAVDLRSPPPDPTLTSLAGTATDGGIYEDLLISDNDSLRDLSDALSGWSVYEEATITIDQNGALEACDVDAFVDALTGPDHVGEIIVENNLGTCP